MQFSPQWRIGLKSGVLVWLALSCAATSFAQSLGEIAQQERERKKEQPPRATYVYTNDDLKRQHILVPEDQARVLATRRSTSTPAVQVSQLPVPAPPVPAWPVPASPAPVSAPPVPASIPPASASTVAVVPPPTPLEPPLENSVRNHLQTQLSTPPGISPVPPGALLSPAAGRKTVRPRPVTGLVSHSDFSRPQPHRAILEREPVDSGMAVVTVERGDSLWKLAKRYLGKGTRWRELAALNTQVSNADVIHVGEWIRLPAGDVQTARQTIAPHARAPGSVAPASVVMTSPSPAFTVPIANHRGLDQP
jgi:nucleoid-associated protein YgaU